MFRDVFDERFVVVSAVRRFRAPVETTTYGCDTPAVANAGSSIKSWFRGGQPVVRVVKGAQIDGRGGEHEVEDLRVYRILWLRIRRRAWVADVRTL